MPPENRMMKWPAKRRSKLTHVRAAKRLARAKESKTWMAEEFEGFIWSDECSAEKSDDAFYGAFCHFVVKSVNARVYLRLLEYAVLPVAQRINDTIGDAVFRQDHAPVHTASAGTESIE